MDQQLMRRAIVEFIGPFALCFMGIGSIILFASGTTVDIVAVALAHGLAIGLCITAAGHISGGHFNPAVTISMLATRRLSVNEAVIYIGSQLLGALAACVVLLATFPSELRDAANFGTPSVGTGFSSGNALVAEMVTTFFLVFVIFGVAVDHRSGKAITGLAIGLTITMDILATGPVSGAAMNPARWFGPAVVDGNFSDFWIWIVGPIVGGVVAALLWSNIILGPSDDETGLPEISEQMR
jgi:MIP family channel proteins